MCGITGIYKRKEELSIRELEDFAFSLRHRGPDDFGIYRDNNKALGIGHCRLAIFDISSRAHQPMSYGNGRYWITYNGEIYNFIELRNDLKNDGYIFKSDSDTEVIVAAYNKWGPECQKMFNGMWAFAIWDKTENSLFLSRDRFGIKPLYYIDNESFFAFASETSAFSELKNYKKEFDIELVLQTIEDVYSLCGTGMTIYKGIHQLSAGSYILFSLHNGMKICKWWRTEENIFKVTGSYQDQVEQFKELFIDSCRIRLRSDVPIAFTLSGGLDSSSIYCTCNKMFSGQSHERILKNGGEAYVAVFPNTDVDESGFAREAIKQYNGNMRTVYHLATDMLVDEIIDQVKKCDFIFLTPPIGINIYKAMKNDNRKISIDGHGVDEMLFGYENLIKELYSDLLGTENEEDKKQVLKIYKTQKYLHLIHKIIFYLSRRGISTFAVFYREYFMKLLNKCMGGLFSRNRIQHDNSWTFMINKHTYHSEFDPSTLSRVDIQASYKYFHHYFLPVLLRNYDIWSMASGVEVRTPFLDWRLVTYIFSLPLAAKIGNGYNKRILRDAMKNILPEKIRKRRLKIGLNAPMEDWFSHQMKTFILDEVNSHRFLNSTIWDGKKIRDFVEKKMINKSWNQNVDCFKFWPYLNAHILMNHN